MLRSPLGRPQTLSLSRLAVPPAVPPVAGGVAAPVSGFELPPVTDKTMPSTTRSATTTAEAMKPG